jgi:hypothetical protein
MTWWMVIMGGEAAARCGLILLLEIDHSPRPHPPNTPKALVIPRRLISDNMDYPQCRKQSMRKKSSQGPLRRGISSMVRLSHLCESVISHTISLFFSLSFELSVQGIFGWSVPESKSELAICALTGLLNHLFGRRYWTWLNLSDPELRTKICVSAVKIIILICL